ncbi:GGDEF domain-containing protein [Vibrio atlanticus]|uniref:GGDEF domain-containing protein n=1 Tax=Vibrio atlanticus TaxID=693153 RepID=UPI0021658E48|nr:GGDEF domain-containing protein [Vibrio atlanticus]
MTLDLDIRTLCLIMVFLSGTYCIGLVIKQQSQARILGMRSFFCAIFLLMVGFSLLSFGSHISPWLSKITSNMAIAGGFASMVFSLTQLRQSPSLYSVCVFLGLPVVIVTLIYFTLYDASTNARVITMSFYITLCTVASVLVIKTGTVADVKAALVLLMSVFSAHSIFMLVRIWITLKEPNIDDFLQASSIHQLAFIITAILLSTIGFTYNWLLNARLMQSLYSSSMKDSLTQLYNRRAMNEMLRQEWMRSVRHNHPLSVIILDIDHFKQVNDQHGHQTGDQVLKKIGIILQHNLRAADIPFRYGGEEFLIVLPDTRIGEACKVAEKLRIIIEETKFWRQQSANLTASFGLSELWAEDKVPSMIKRADEALYYAKENGRNTVCALTDEQGKLTKQDLPSLASPVQH